MDTDDLIQIFNDTTDNTAEPPLWSESSVEGFAIKAENEACDRRPLLMTDSESTICEIAITADQTLYSKHVAVREIFYAKFVPTASPTEVYDVYITNVKELMFMEPDYNELTGPPKYLILTDGQVEMVPPPEEDGTLCMHLSHIPLVDMVTKGSPTVNEAHHYNLVYWMMHLAYEKRDSEVFDPKKSLDYAGRFASYFGDPKSSDAIKSVNSVRVNRPRADGGWI